MADKRLDSGQLCRFCLSVIEDADLLLVPVVAQPGQQTGQEVVEVRAQPRSVLSDVHLQCYSRQACLVVSVHCSVNLHLRDPGEFVGQLRAPPVLLS